MEARRVDKMSTDKPKTYIKDIAENKLKNEKVPIPEDVVSEMLKLIREAIIKKSEYKSLKRKYDLKRAVRIKGSGYAYGKSNDDSKNAKYDLFNATEMEAKLEKKKTELAKILLNFLFLKAVYSNQERGAQTQKSGIKMCDYPEFEKFQKEFFGDGFSLAFNDFGNDGKLKTASLQNIPIDKKSVVHDIWIYKIQSDDKQNKEVKASDVFGTDAKVENDYTKWAKFSDSNDTIEHYTTFLERVYSKLKEVKSDKKFHNSKAKLAKAFKDAVDKINNNATVTMRGYWSDCKEVSKQYNKLIEIWEDIEELIKRVEPVVSEVKDDKTKQTFYETRTTATECSTKLENMKNEIMKSKSVMKYFEIYNEAPTVDSMGIVAPIKEHITSTSNKVEKIISMILDGQKIEKIKKNWVECQNEIEILNKDVDIFKKHEYGEGDNKFSVSNNLCNEKVKSYVEMLLMNGYGAGKKYTQELKSSAESMKKYKETLDKNKNTAANIKREWENLKKDIDWYSSKQYIFLQKTYKCAQTVSFTLNLLKLMTMLIP